MYGTGYSTKESRQITTGCGATMNNRSLGNDGDAGLVGWTHGTRHAEKAVTPVNDMRRAIVDQSTSTDDMNGRDRPLKEDIELYQELHSFPSLEYGNCLSCNSSVMDPTRW